MVGINSLHVRPTANRFLSAPPDSKDDPKAGPEQEQRNSECSPVSLPVSSLLFALAEII